MINRTDFDIFQYVNFEQFIIPYAIQSWFYQSVDVRRMCLSSHILIE